MDLIEIVEKKVKGDQVIKVTLRIDGRILSVWERGDDGMPRETARLIPENQVIDEQLLRFSKQEYDKLLKVVYGIFRQPRYRQLELDLF